MTSLERQLALYGGPPAVVSGPPPWPVADEDVRRALETTYADGSWGRYQADNTERLVARLGARHEVSHVILCSSGTVAMELALRGLSVGLGDEVVLAGYDFPGNFRAIEAVGALPVLVDIDPENWSLDPTQLEPAVSRRTKAVIVSHLHGGEASIAEVMRIAKDSGLRVVEDACQVPGAVVGGRLAGSWGDVGVLSFGGSKLLTAGRGGALLIQESDVRQRIKIFSERGNLAFPLSELQAAVLLPQLDKLDERHQIRAKNVRRLFNRTSRLAALEPLIHRGATDPSYYKVAWRYQGTATRSLDREHFLAAIRAEGVEMGAGFRGFTLRGPKRCRKVGRLPHSARTAATSILLHHPVLLEPEQAVDQVALALDKVLSFFEPSQSF